VFFTGAGMSKESGLMTFRGEDGMWDDIDPDAVASLKKLETVADALAVKNCVRRYWISLIQYVD